MLCEKCKNKKPTVFFTDAGGINHSLCAVCASGFNHAQAVTEDSTPEIIFSPYSLMLSNLSLKVPLPTNQGLICEACKTSGEIRCVSCAEKILRERTSSPKRMPRRVRVERERMQSIDELKKRLEHSLAHEDYESAASLRDQIRKLQAVK